MSRHRIISFIIIIILLFLSSILPSIAGTVSKSNYRGWETFEMNNKFIEVQVAPVIGGRIIQFKLGNFEFLWVNDELAEKIPPSSGLAPDGGFLNYGGDKLWPAPQGWDGEHQWPGPPDPILDSTPHQGIILTAKGSPVSVKTISRKDSKSGVQFSRVLKVYDNAARLSLDMTMTNVDIKPRRWGIWDVTQHNTANRNGSGFDRNIWTYTPLNPKSMYPKGYNVLYGIVNNPSFKTDHECGLITFNYKHIVGKIGIDCSDGWLAVVNGTNGYVFVERFRYFSDKEYPDGASVEFWSHGDGNYYAAKTINRFTPENTKGTYFLESEVLSPFAELKPGESYTFHLDWYAAYIGGNYPVLNCTEAGITCEPFTYTIRNRTTHILKGRFGVFYTGTIMIVLYDKNGKEISRGWSKSKAVTPLLPFKLSEEWGIKDIGKYMLEDATTASLLMVDVNSKIIGELASTLIRVENQK